MPAFIFAIVFAVAFVLIKKHLHWTILLICLDYISFYFHRFYFFELFFNLVNATIEPTHKAIR